jgi:hypothetical protein
MKRSVFLLSMMGVMVTIFASAAFAVIKTGTQGSDVLRGTDDADTLYGLDARDVLRGLERFSY